MLVSLFLSEKTLVVTIFFSKNMASFILISLLIDYFSCLFEWFLTQAYILERHCGLDPQSPL